LAFPGVGEVALQSKSWAPQAMKRSELQRLVRLSLDLEGGRSRWTVS
jgi:hypothetical protein